MQHKKHILVISQYFYPEPFRINDMCVEWVNRGYKVTVLTGIPNYPQGKFYNGYGFTKKRKEVWNGVDIIRIPLIPRGNNSIGLVMNYFSFVISGFFWKIFTKIKADYVFMYEVSPMTQALVGVWYAKKRKIPCYLYVQDLWPENVEIVTGISSPLVIKPIEKMVNYIYRNCTKIFATSRSFVEAICNRKEKVERKKVHFWPQYAEDFYKPVKKDFNCKEKNASFKVIFTGNIGYAQGLEVLPETARLLKNENVEFIIVGDGRYKEEFLKVISEKDVKDKFIMVSRQPAEEIPRILGNADVAFLSFQDVDLWTMTIPAKLQSYMACGMPIIASASGETERILDEAQCGICSKIGDSVELSKAIQYMMTCDLKIMGENSRKYFETNFNKKSLMDEFEQYLT